MKYPISPAVGGHIASPSPRRAWIEMLKIAYYFSATPRRPPHGGRGLKLQRCQSRTAQSGCRPPHGGRGLKFRGGEKTEAGKNRSPSPRRAWIEIEFFVRFLLATASPSPRRAWIEMASCRMSTSTRRSRPPHGGRGLKWKLLIWIFLLLIVALPTEGVD